MRNYQRDKYTALRTKSEKTLKKLAKEYGYDKLPKHINNVAYYAKRLSNFIEEKQYSNYQEGVIKKNSNSGSKLYKEFLKKSGLHDTTQAKQIYKDIKEFTKIAKAISKNIDNLDLDERKLRELKNILKSGTTIKEYLNNRHPQMLKYSPLEQTERLYNKINPHYADEILKRKNCSISATEYKNFLNMFNKLTIGQKMKFNSMLYSRYYSEYEYSKAFGEEFNSFEVLKRLIKDVKNK